MKKSILILVLIFIANISFAQSNKIFGSIGGGVSIPISEFSNNHELGFNIAGNLGYQFHDMIGGRFDLQYNSFNYKDQTSFYGDVTGDPHTLFTISADAIVANFSDLKKNQAFIPYGVLGFGLYFSKVGDIILGTLGTVKGISETYAGLGIGGGAIYKLSKDIGVLAEIKYSTTLGGAQLNYLPFRIAIMFTP